MEQWKYLTSLMRKWLKPDVLFADCTRLQYCCAYSLNFCCIWYTWLHLTTAVILRQLILHLFQVVQCYML